MKTKNQKFFSHFLQAENIQLLQKKEQKSVNGGGDGDIIIQDVTVV